MLLGGSGFHSQNFLAGGISKGANCLLSLTTSDAEQSLDDTNPQQPLPTRGRRGDGLGTAIEVSLLDNLR